MTERNAYDLNKVGGIKNNYQKPANAYDLNLVGGFNQEKYLIKNKVK